MSKVTIFIFRSVYNPILNNGQERLSMKGGLCPVFSGYSLVTVCHSYEQERNMCLRDGRREQIKQFVGNTLNFGAIKYTYFVIRRTNRVQITDMLLIEQILKGAAEIEYVNSPTNADFK